MSFLTEKVHPIAYGQDPVFPVIHNVVFGFLSVGVMKASYKDYYCDTAEQCGTIVTLTEFLQNIANTLSPVKVR